MFTERAINSQEFLSKYLEFIEQRKSLIRAHDANGYAEALVYQDNFLKKIITDALRIACIYYNYEDPNALVNLFNRIMVDEKLKKKLLVECFKSFTNVPDLEIKNYIFKVKLFLTDRI